MSPPAQMTLDVDGSWQNGVDGQPPAEVTQTQFSEAGAAVMIIKVELQLETSQLHLTASGTGLKGNWWRAQEECPLLYRGGVRG